MIMLVEKGRLKTYHILILNNQVKRDAWVSLEFTKSSHYSINISSQKRRGREKDQCCMSYSCCCLPNGTPLHLQQGILQQRKTKIQCMFKNNNLVLKQGSSVKIFPVARYVTSVTIFWQDPILEVQV
jgi:hypothetical protein